MMEIREFGLLKLSDACGWAEVGYRNKLPEQPEYTINA